MICGRGERRGLVGAALALCVACLCGAQPIAAAETREPAADATMQLFRGRLVSMHFAVLEPAATPNERPPLRPIASFLLDEGFLHAPRLGTPTLIDGALAGVVDLEGMTRERHAELVVSLLPKDIALGDAVLVGIRWEGTSRDIVALDRADPARRRAFLERWAEELLAGHRRIVDRIVESTEGSLGAVDLVLRDGAPSDGEDADIVALQQRRDRIGSTLQTTKARIALARGTAEELAVLSAELAGGDGENFARLLARQRASIASLEAAAARLASAFADADAASRKRIEGSAAQPE